MSNLTPYLAFLHNEADLAAMRSVAQSKGWPAENVHTGGIAAATEYLKTHGAPQVLFVEIPSAEAAPAALERLAEVCAPDTRVVVVGAVNEFSFYKWLTDIGISSYLLTPLKAETIAAEYEKIMAPPPVATPEAGRAPGRVIGVMGTRGGAGATSTVLYLAALLARQGKSVAAVDLDPQDGSLALLLDMEPSRGLREAMEKPDRIDGLFLERAMQKAEQGFYVLSAEEGLGEPIQYHADAAEVLLTELRGKFDFIVLDLPRRANPFFRYCVTLCEPLFLLSERSLQGLRDAVRLVELFKDQLQGERLQLVASKVGIAPKFELSDADMAKVVGQKPAYSLAFSPDVFMTISADLEGLKLTTAPAMKTLMQMVGSVDKSAKNSAGGGNASSGKHGVLGWKKPKKA